jgi:hypothetical protein
LSAAKPHAVTTTARAQEEHESKHARDAVEKSQDDARNGTVPFKANSGKARVWHNKL